MSDSSRATSSLAATASAPGLRSPRVGGRGSSNQLLERIADALFRGVCALAALVAVALILAIAYQLFEGAGPAISRFGLAFLVHEVWQPNFNRLGAATFVYGTLITSAVTMALAVPIGVSIGLYLSTVASGPVSRAIGPLVEMLAAIPSVILGFWGILLFGPFVRSHIEPFLHNTLGFLPIFGAPSTTGASLFTASLILTIMVVPIVASISRDLFMTVPDHLRDGATALGATRWEMVRGVILPATASGVTAAAFLGLGRALGEAIATSQVLGAGNFIHVSLFETGDTLAARIAGQAQGAPFKLQHASLFYLGVILLGISLIANLASRALIRRFDAHRAVAR
jgi:phosphate transport system permease protein